MKTFGRIAGWICLAVSVLMLLIGDMPACIMLACIGGIDLLLVAKLADKEKAARRNAERAALENSMKSIGKARLERKAEEAAAVREEMHRRKQARQSEESQAALLDRLGAQYEADGDIDKAVFYYTQAVAAAGNDAHPYERLATLYRIRGEHAEELRVSTAAVQMLERQNPFDAGMAARFKDRIAYAEAKLRAGRAGG